MQRLIFCAAVVLAARQCALAQQLPLEPLHDSGQNVTGAFEGWFPNPDGTFSLLLGYYNRNTKQEVDIPIGPENNIEPGGPDRGQPTHFLPGRQWGMFTVTVPKDFGKNKLRWTLTLKGRTSVIPAHLDPLWEVAPFREATGNTPPVVSFEEGGPRVQGPSPFSVSRTAQVGMPLALSVRVADDAKLIPGMQKPRTPAVTLAWSKFRGPGKVTFSEDKPAVTPGGPAPATGEFSGTATTTATFSEPGDYIVHVSAMDWSGPGGRGFQCCWTVAQVKVVVKP